MLTRDAESYIRLIMLSLAEHRRTEDVLSAVPFPVGRLISRQRGSGAFQVRLQGTLTRIVSITEAYTAGQLRTHLRERAFQPPPITDYLLDLYGREEDAWTLSWPAMKDRYAKWVGGIELAKCDGYEAVEAMVDARNAIMHGLGRLTPRQQRGNKARAHLTKFGITILPNNELVIPHDVVYTGALRCRDFIVALDTRLTVQHHHPKDADNTI